MRQDAFLAQLHQEAAKQAQLHHERVLPPQLDGLTSFIGQYSWQVILVTSGFTALLLEVLRGWQ